MLEKLYFSLSDAVEFNAEEDTRRVGGNDAGRERPLYSQAFQGGPARHPRYHERERESACVRMCVTVRGRYAGKNKSK